MQKKTLIALVLSVVCIATVWVYYAYKTLLFESSPTYALVKVEDAVLAKDLPSFEKYVHMQRFSDGLLKQILHPEGDADAEENKAEESADAEPSFFDKLSLVGEKFKERFTEYVQPELSNSLAEQMRDFVLEGRFIDGIDPKDPRSSLMLSSVWRKIYGEKLLYKGFSDVSVTEDQATAIVTLYRPDLDYNAPFHVTLERSADAWQVVSIDNLSHILERIRFLEEKIVEERHAAVRAQIDAVLQIVHSEKSAGVSQWGVGKGVLLSVAFENVGAETIASFEAQVRFVDAKGYVLRQVVIEDHDPLLPADISEKSWPMAINPLSGPDMQVYADETVSMQVAVQRVVFENGTTLSFEDK